jgi:hypothetical protein
MINLKENKRGIFTTAQAKIMTAEADAKAYELVQQKLTPLIIQKMQIDRWDGKLPMVTSGNTLFSLGGNSS